MHVYVIMVNSEKSSIAGEVMELIYNCYPPVNEQRCGKSPFSFANSSIYGPCSTFMLV